MTVRSIFNSMCGKEYFQNFINGESSQIAEPAPGAEAAGKNQIAPAGASLKESVKLFAHIYEEELEDSDMVEDMLEEESCLWCDDLGYVLLAILKDLKRIAKEGKVTVPDVFMKEDDEEFAKKLLRVSMINYDEYTELAQSFLSKWDVERVVSTDLTFIVMGIAEAVNFETIPLKVTINEYVEISKYYSTPKSKVFVNGLLDRVLQKLQSEGKIKKAGRGLVGGLEQN